MNSVVDFVLKQRREDFERERNTYRALNVGEIIHRGDVIINDSKITTLPQVFWGKPVIRTDLIAIFRKKQSKPEANPETP